MWRSILSAVFRNRGRSWNILPVDTVVHLYHICGLFFYILVDDLCNVSKVLLFVTGIGFAVLVEKIFFNTF